MVQRHSARTVKSYFGHNKRADKRIRLKKGFQERKIMLPCKGSSPLFCRLFYEVCFGRVGSGKHTSQQELSHQVEIHFQGRIVCKHVQRQKSLPCRHTWCRLSKCRRVSSDSSHYCSLVYRLSNSSTCRRKVRIASKSVW